MLPFDGADHPAFGPCNTVELAAALGERTRQVGAILKVLELVLRDARLKTVGERLIALIDAAAAERAAIVTVKVMVKRRVVGPIPLETGCRCCCKRGWCAVGKDMLSIDVGLMITQ